MGPKPLPYAGAPALVSKAERSAATRGALMREARRLFATQGFAATSAEDVLEPLAVTRGALYHQFEGMRDLFQAVCREMLIEANAEVCAVASAAEGGPVAQLRAGCIAYLRLAARPEYVRIALTDGPAVLGCAEMEALAREAWLSTCTVAVERAVAAGCSLPDDVEAAARIVDGALCSLSEWAAGVHEDRAAILRRAEAAIACLIAERAPAQRLSDD